jgi:S-adenosylmethionine:tRNA ribosyltransferase-isomerase
MTAAVQREPALLEATAPPERRGIARDEVQLLVTQCEGGTHAHAQFVDLPMYLRTGDLLVVNDSATLPAALRAQRANGETLALHLSTRIDQRIWMVEPRDTVVCGEELRLADGGSAVMIAPVEPEHPRVWYAWFQVPLAMPEYLMRVGEPIRYSYVTERFPLRDYQTMFAHEPGSSEMPSAGRPFTPRVVSRTQQLGIELATITLHCGVASYELPERPGTERYAVPRATAEAVNAARRDGRRVIAVGSTVLRALESAFNAGEVVASSGWTGIVIDEQSRLNAVDGLLTGFHSAGATHQSLLRAFLDRRTLDEAYAQAAERGYYSHEFGDVHLIL